MKGVYLVTDPRYTAMRSMETLVAEAARAGLACVQLREKNASTREFVELALRVKEVLEPFGVPLIINDRIDIVPHCPQASRQQGHHRPLGGNLGGRGTGAES